MKALIFTIILVISTVAAGADSRNALDAKTELDRSIVCSSILTDIVIYRREIVTANSSIANNARLSKSEQNPDMREKLYQSSVKWSTAVQSSYAALASAVSIYDSLGCSKAELITEMRCQDERAKCK